MEAPNGNSSITAGSSSNNLSQWPPSFEETLELIRQNRIPYVDLSNQHLDATATRELAEAFNGNNTVVELRLCANRKIGDDGIIPLARMLERNRTLTALALVDIGLSRKGVRHLVTCLYNNVFIQRLHLTEPGKVKIRKAKPYLLEVDKILDSNAKFKCLLNGTATVLDLSGRRQSFINTNILTKFSNITILDYSHNRLEEVPAEIRYLTELQCLNVSFNRLVYLPDDIGTLAALVHLDVSHNALSDLPNTITSLTNLQTLRLSFNCITNLSRFQFGNFSIIRLV
ncbi:transforming growth factor beta activator LRRC32, variant 2 [Balamuthia mandrillaris]